jgi:hypothetical protein
LDEDHWPWELIDVEPLLEEGKAVLHYLGPHQLDVAALRARFRMTCDLDVVLEPVGTDLEDEQGGAPIGVGVPSAACSRSSFRPPEGGTPARSNALAPAGRREAGCGACDCGAGGCATAVAERAVGGAPSAQASPRGCAPTSHGACASCGISGMLAARRRPSCS